MHLEIEVGRAVAINTSKPKRHGNGCRLVIGARMSIAHHVPEKPHQNVLFVITQIDFRVLHQIAFCRLPDGHVNPCC